MTKQEAKNLFINMNFGELVDYHSRKDHAAIRQCWNDYVDMLQKSFQITNRQADTWVNPFVQKEHR